MSTQPVVVTPEALTLEDVTRWQGSEMRLQLQRPGMREAVDRVLKNLSLEQVQAAEQAAAAETAANAPQPTLEEQAVVEQAAAVQAETERVAAEQAAATAQAEAELARIVAEEAAKPKRIVLDYQIRDEEGNPIGRPTHFEAASDEEMRGKVQEAHIQAARAFHRLKKQKLVIRQPEPPPQAGMSDDDIMAAIRQTRSDDPKVAVEAQKRLTKNEVGQQLEADKRQLAEETEKLRQANVSLRFLKKHLDFNNCEANVKLMASFIEENQLEWTDDNLDAAFLACESELAPVEKPVVLSAPANPAPVALVASTASVAPVAAPTVIPAVAPAVQPTPTALAPAAAPANPAVAPPKPGVNGGLMPGQSVSGVRPTAKPTGLTMAEIRAMDTETYKAAMRNPAKRAEIEKAISAVNQAKGR